LNNLPISGDKAMACGRAQEPWVGMRPGRPHSCRAAFKRDRGRGHRWNVDTRRHRWGKLGRRADACFDSPRSPAEGW